MDIAEKINRFNAYTDLVSAANKLVGVTAEVTLPEFEFTSETLSLAGMAGEVDSPSMGQVKSTQIEIPFSNVSYEMFRILADDNASVILRAAQEKIETDSLKKTHIGRVVTVKGMTKKVNYGKLVKGGYGNPSITKEVIYYKDELDGKVLTEVDKFNGKYVVNGQDIMADIEELI